MLLGSLHVGEDLRVRKRTAYYIRHVSCFRLYFLFLLPLLPPLGIQGSCPS